MRHNRQEWARLAYWTLPIIIIVFQVIYSINSFGQIRTEETIDSIRSVWWFQNRLVTDGGYSILGWYTLLFWAYNIFGFTLHTAKFVKLAVVLIGLFAQAAVFKKFLGVKAAWLPLLTIGLSPTLLFFNSLQLSYGLEVSYFFICLYLLSLLDFNSKNSLPITALLFAVAMFGWLSYPAFLNYIFIIWAIYIYKSSTFQNGRKVLDKLIIRRILLAVVFFLIPLILEVAYIQNRHLLFFDRTLQRGLFRSNGGLEVNPIIFLDNLRLLFNDLFVNYNSYYFEIPKVEFSDYAIIPVIFVLLVSIYVVVKKKKLRSITLTLNLSLIFFLIVTNLVGPIGLGGIRRATVVLIIFYLLFGFVWKFILSNKQLRPAFRYFLILIFILVPIHHILVFSTNLAYLKVPTPYKSRQWLSSSNPQKDLDSFVGEVQREDLELQCKDQDQKVVNCGGYSVIEAAIKGDCYWNRLYCYKIQGYDTKLKKFIPLSFDFYKNNNWER